MPKIPTNQDFDKKLFQVHGDKFYRLENRVPNQKYLRIFCNSCKQAWTPKISHLLDGFGCPNCRKISVTKFDKKVEAIFDKNYIRVESVDESKGLSEQKIKMKCLICQTTNEQYGKHILAGHGCWSCMRKKLIDNNRITINEFILRSKEINGNKYRYSEIKSIHNQSQRVPLICNTHGIFYQTISDHLYNKAGCPKCKESKGEKRIRTFLEEKKINYEQHKGLPGCKFKKQLFFDFYIQDKNLCIEFDGEQHSKGLRKINKRKFTKEEQLNCLKLYQIRDKIKDEYCIGNSIRLLRINYKDLDYVEKILTKYL